MPYKPNLKVRSTEYDPDLEHILSIGDYNGCLLIINNQK